MLTLLLTIGVHNHVMRYPAEPERELAGIGIFTFLQSCDDLDESFLEHVISQLGVANHEQYVIVELLLIAS